MTENFQAEYVLAKVKITRFTFHPITVAVHLQYSPTLWAAFGSNSPIRKHELSNTIT